MGLPPDDPERARQEAERATAELTKVHAETTKVNAETAKIRAERDKAAADARKIDFELDPAAHGYQRGVAERERIEAEKAKLQSDTRLSSRTLDWEVVKGFGSAGLAFAAIWTAYNAFSNHSDDERARHRAELSHFIENLGAKDPSSRVAAAIGLQPALTKSEAMRPVVIDGLAYAIGLETNPAVQQAIAESLEKAGPDAMAPLRRVLPRVDSEVRTGFTRIARATTAAQRRDEQELVTARQASMFDIVMTISGLSNLAPGSGHPPDFSDLNFKAYPFYGVSDLRHAVFRNSKLWQADFYHVDLRGADFTNASAPEASFRDAQLGGARFTGADVTNADFSGADLAGVLGMTEDQIGRAKDLSCARIDPPLGDKLKDRTQPKSGDTCAK